MSHLALELALWILFAFFVGCILGCLLRRMFTRDAVSVAAEGPAYGASGEAPVPDAKAVPVEPVVTEALPVARTPARPKGIAAARGGTPDNLQRISGVGPKNEKTLHSLGFFHFDQIAAWTAEEVAWVDDHLKFGGRIGREKWINQARLLAEGKEEDFHRLYGTGGVSNKQGETESGSRTRKD